MGNPVNPIEVMSESEAKRLLNRIADNFEIGVWARSGYTILVNIKNTIRRADCLSRIEAFHTVTETDEDGYEYEESLLNWGEDPDVYIETYKRALAEPAVPPWQPIETAPKDGREVILRRGDRVTAGEWQELMGTDEEEGCAWWLSLDGGFSDDEPPTHWMPLPDPHDGEGS